MQKLTALGTCLFLLVLCAARIVTLQAQTSGRKPRIHRLPPPTDPLEPWSLESNVVTSIPLPLPEVPAASPFDSLLSDVAIPDLPTDVDSAMVETVAIVRCRQVTLDLPSKAHQLDALLQAGVVFEKAIQLLKLENVDEKVREYALDDLQPEIRYVVEALADSGWSQRRSWNGRSFFLQLLSREERPRSTLPELGKGLGVEERQVLFAELERLRPKAQPRQFRVPENVQSDFVAAKVTEQAPAEYPAAAMINGEVTVTVSVGRLNQVLEVDVVRSTDPMFEQPAMDAARKSTYQAATRGTTQTATGTVQLTYIFTNPDAPSTTTGQGAANGQDSGNNP